VVPGEGDDSGNDQQLSVVNCRRPHVCRTGSAPRVEGGRGLVGEKWLTMFGKYCCLHRSHNHVTIYGRGCPAVWRPSLPIGRHILPGGKPLSTVRPLACGATSGEGHTTDLHIEPLIQEIVSCHRLIVSTEGRHDETFQMWLTIAKQRDLFSRFLRKLHKSDYQSLRPERMLPTGKIVANANSARTSRTHCC
jgi:hypothetical protein